MIDFNKNKLINAVLEQYYNTFSRTLDTCDFVPEKYNRKIHKYIFKNMRKKFRQINKEDRLYRKAKARNAKERSKLSKKKERSERSERIKAERLCRSFDNATSESKLGVTNP